MARQKGVALASVTYLQQQRQTIYIALGEANSIWDTRDVEDFRKLWNKGFSIRFIAQEFARPPLEIAILIMDQAEQGRIKQRSGGLWGVGK